MNLRATENHLIRKTRWLTQMLILSGTLNIGLVATFVYFVLQEGQKTLNMECKPLKEHSSKLSNLQFLKAYSILPYQELLLRLENKELIEDGLAKRDLALSCLVAFHHFNLEKSLPGVLLQKRSLPFTNKEGQETIELPVFPGLLDEQFLAILRFAKTEKWPLTSQGLFYELKRSLPPYDSSLISAFCLSTEFQTLQTLFSKTALALPQEYLISLLCEGSWQALASFVQDQQQHLDLSCEKRRSFLLSYLECRSILAAQLLLQTDLEFVLKRCDDAHILLLLDLCPENSVNLENCAKELLTSPRTDAVYKRAAQILYGLKQEQMPEPYDHHLVIQRFFPTKTQEAAFETKQPSSTKSEKKFYIVENGDSLWKIARKFHVSVEQIMQVNHLETEKLRPGKQLEIPAKTK